MLKPFDAIMSEIIERIMIITFDNCKKFFLTGFLQNLFPSTITKEEIALTKVSIVLTVNDTARIIIITDKNSVLPLNKIEKKAKIYDLRVIWKGKNILPCLNQFRNL